MTEDDARRSPPGTWYMRDAYAHLVATEDLTADERGALLELGLRVDYRTGQWPRLSSARQVATVRGRLEDLAAEMGRSRSALDAMLRRFACEPPTTKRDINRDRDRRPLSRPLVRADRFRGRGVIVSFLAYPWLVHLTRFSKPTE